MLKRLLSPGLHLVRRAIGIPQLEAAIRDARSPAQMPEALQAYVQAIEDRTRNLAGLSLPLIVSPSVTQKDVLRFCAQLAPYDVEGFNKIRLGNQHDGGYIFIDDFADVALVISCGIDHDVTFDLACAAMGKRILQFDHTVDGPPTEHPNFIFRKQAVDALGIIPDSIKLWEIVEQEGTPPNSDLLLKIDIDGGEWTTFANFPIDQLKRFRQITCEFHWSSRLKDPEYFSLCSRAIDNICTAFFPAHLHANNFVNFSNLMGVPMPEVYEVTFVNRDLYRPSTHQKGAPTALDNPNNPDKPDLFLGSPFHIA